MQASSTLVALLGQATYDSPSLDDAMAAVLPHCGPFGNLHGRRVLLKPNLISTRNGALACTDGRFVAAVGQWFVDQGARVAVGDSPAFGSARSALAAAGALSRLSALGVPVVEFNRTREVELPCGVKVPLAAAALESDLLVNLPRVKVHAQMRLTLALKNYFGCVAGLHKPWWHMVHGGSRGRFVQLLLELPGVLPPSCSVVDGIIAMHGTGPIHGRPYPLGLIAAGCNPLAVDTALMAVLGVEPGCSPLWFAASQAGMAGSRLDQLVFPLASPDRWQVQGFEIPESLMSIRFNPFRFTASSARRLFLRAIGR